ncbi:hypothetical protein AMTR_s00106p00117270 [Amborella trichopoda]|uniref:Uncharacterized protein n=1 Tax=Amborella trichopoda TaxID=13333 RepID=W1NZG4_AMBTC|nr:hypothetical protein AMTR_s00106p00117270 [Amborella trichopoda]
MWLQKVYCRSSSLYYQSDLFNRGVLWLQKVYCWSESLHCWRVCPHCRSDLFNRRSVVAPEDVPLERVIALLEGVLLEQVFV